jgi:hypothetical protein
MMHSTLRSAHAASPSSACALQRSLHGLQVDVDIYRRLGPVRETPLFGASCWTQEALIRWRELNSAEHFLWLVTEVTPLCETLPLLVHHADKVGSARPPLQDTMREPSQQCS